MALQNPGLTSLTWKGTSWTWLPHPQTAVTSAKKIQMFRLFTILIPLINS